MTRGALTTFSIANDVAKYFAIIPAMFAGVFPVLSALNIMHLHSPQSAILSAVIFNALIIVALIPLALKGVKYEPKAAEALLRNNLLIYGVGGIIVPFIGIKAIDMLLGRAAPGVIRTRRRRFDHAFGTSTVCQFAAAVPLRQAGESCIPFGGHRFVSRSSPRCCSAWAIRCWSPASPLCSFRIRPPAA